MRFFFQKYLCNTHITFKAVCSHCILIPRAQLEVVPFFWCQMKPHIFLIIAPKFQLQIHYTSEVIAENVPISDIPILIFICIFITVSSPVSYTYFCPGKKIKSNLEVKLYKMCLTPKVNQFRVENTHGNHGKF